MHNYKKLKIWQDSIELVGLIYKKTLAFPKEEIFALQSQIRRAAVSIPSNIAEGAGRQTISDFKHFLTIANGSCNELETQLIIASNLNYIKENDLTDMQTKIQDIQKMIYAFKKNLK
jgi:four helix bundle protein